MNVRAFNKIHYDIIILGGGIAGCAAAKKLSTKYKVAILEKRAHVLQGTSRKTPGRMGLGFHYFDPNTSKACLERTTKFVLQNTKNHKLPLIGDENKDSEHLRKGRYFITKNSLISKATIFNCYNEIKNHYRKLVASNPALKIWGHPDNFVRVLDKSEYNHLVNTNLIECAIETPEYLLNTDIFLNQYQNEVVSCRNIDVYTNSSVERIFKHRDKYQVSLSTKDDIMNISSTFVVNSTWENIEEIESNSGIKTKSDRTNRVKFLAEIELPPELHRSNSMFFCFGPHAMFTNLGNGRGNVTYAPVTNHQYHETSLTDNSKRLVYHNDIQEELSLKGNEIIRGASKYIPSLIDSKLIRVSAGIVKSYGQVNITSASSDFHARDYDGVQDHGNCYIENAAMKLTYCEHNADKVLSIVERHLGLSQLKKIVI